METVEINKILHEFMEVGHRVDAKGYCLYETTDKNGEVFGGHRVPDYTSEESPRRLLAEVEGKFVAAFGEDAYFTALVLADNGNPDGTVGIAVATASALTRSTAMAKYLQEKK